MDQSPKVLAELLNSLPPYLLGALLSMVISVLRVIYDKEETKPLRVILESLLCGVLSLTISSGITALGMNDNWAIFAGGTIGYFGSTSVRAIAVKIVNKKVDKL